MPRSSRTLHSNFTTRLDSLNVTRNNFESAHSAGNISSIDIIQAYAGLYLDIFTEFEALIEALFIGLLEGKITHVDRTVKRKVKISPVVQSENVMIGEKRAYADWLPYPDATLKRAKIYFNNSMPFDKLTSIQKDEISRYHKIRNAIAHKGGKAKKEFDHIIEGMTLLPIEKTPQGFLRNIPNPTTGFTQLENISNQLLLISNTLCN